MDIVGTDTEVFDVADGDLVTAEGFADSDGNPETSCTSISTATIPICLRIFTSKSRDWWLCSDSESSSSTRSSGDRPKSSSLCTAGVTGFAGVAFVAGFFNHRQSCCLLEITLVLT